MDADKYHSKVIFHTTNHESPKSVVNPLLQLENSFYHSVSNMVNHQHDNNVLGVENTL